MNTGKQIMLIENFHYRPEIDGLRALAVLAVLFFHAGLGFPGGYIGVDIFFVISGFLITSLILKDLQDGKFTLANFWERRARRILPASLVLVLATLAAGWFLLMPSDYAALGKSAVAHALFASNIYFWRTTNYFAGAADEQPLLHTWSLAVEEQFYMVVPLSLLLLFRFRALRTRSALAVIFSLALLGSLVLSILVLPRMQAVTFYLLPTRAWELLCGSVVALVPASRLPRSRVPREALSLLGLAGMVVPMFLYDKETAFPGPAALPPCLGAALFILGSTTLDGPCLPYFARVFSWRPLVFIGLISYSLYLWHWPLVAFSHYWTLESMSLSWRWAIVATSFALAILSWRFVETPFRIRRLAKTRTTMFNWAACGLATSAVCALALFLRHGFPDRFPKTAVGFAAAADEKHAVRFTDDGDASEGNFARFGPHQMVDDIPYVLLWGDSHAGVLVPGLAEWCEKMDMGGCAAVYSSTAPVLHLQQNARFGLKGEKSVVWSNAIVQYANANKIPNVILCSRWHEHFKNDLYAPGTSSKVIFSEALVATVRALAGGGSKVWIVLDVPNHPWPVPRALAKSVLFGNGPFKPSDLCPESACSEMISLIPAVKAAGAVVLDPGPYFRDPSGNLMLQHDSQSLYTDSQHLSRAGALLIQDLFRPVFETYPTTMSR